MNIQSFLNSVNQAFDPIIFESGQCHTLALSLVKKFNGTLIAIIRHDVSDDLKCYSHMVAEIDGICYDINGENADERWCNLFNEEDEFDFITVEPENLSDFLVEWRANLDMPTLVKLDSL